MFFQALTAEAQFNYGLRAGGQLVTVQQTKYPYPDLAWRPSYQGGLFFSYQFSSKFSVVADVLFSDKGFRIDGEDRDYNVHMHYLSIPIMAQYYLNDKLSVLGGAEFNFNLGKRWYADGYNHAANFEAEAGVLGWTLGAAYQLNSRMNITARYSQDLSSYRIHYDDRVPVMEGKPKTIQLSLGYFYQRDEDAAYKTQRWKTFSIGFRQGISKYVLKRYNHGDESEASSGRNGYHAELDFRFSKKNGYTAIGLAYLQKGGSIPGEEGPAIEQDYLSIPLIFGYSPLRTKWLTFSLEGGLAVNASLSAKNVPNVDQLEVDVNRSIISAMYGVELSTNAFDKVVPFIGYRKDRDLSKFAKYETDTDLRHKGRILSFGVRYMVNERSK